MYVTWVCLLNIYTALIKHISENILIGAAILVTHTSVSLNIKLTTKSIMRVVKSKIEFFWFFKLRELRNFMWQNAAQKTKKVLK